MKETDQINVPGGYRVTRSKGDFFSRAPHHRIFLAVMLAVGPKSVWQAAHAEDALGLFVKACAPCHSKDGKAQTPAAKKLGVHDLSQSKLTDEQIVQQIRDGKQPEQKDSKMPAFKEKLTSEQINSLVPVVKGFRK